MSGKIDQEALAQALGDPAAAAAALDLDTYIKRAGDGSVTLTLQYPITQLVDVGDGKGEREEQVKTLSFRRPKGKHMKRLMSPEDGDDVGVIEEILIELADVRADLVQDHMDAVDYQRFLAVMNYFFPKAPTGPKASSS